METDLSKLPRGRVLWRLFFNFFKIALFVVGGGYAIILAAEDIFIRKLHWLRDGELMDMLAIIQTIPGLMAGNAAIYVGYRAAGALGALVALSGVALPSFLIITAVAMGGTPITGGKACISGTMLAVIILGIIRNALTLMSISSDYQQWITGFLLLISVLVSGIRIKNTRQNTQEKENE